MILRLIAPILATLALIAAIVLFGLFLLLSAIYKFSLVGFLLFWLYLMVGIGSLYFINYSLRAHSSQDTKKEDSKRLVETKQSIHDWLIVALKSLHRPICKYRSIDDIHLVKSVRNQLLRMEDLLLDLYITPWFQFITTVYYLEHSYNPLPVNCPDLIAAVSSQPLEHAHPMVHSEFISTLRYDIRYLILELQNRIKSVDWTGFILELFIPLITQHIHDFKRASQEISQKGNRNLTASEELDLFTASLFRQGKLHAALGGHMHPMRRKSLDSKLLNSNGLLLNTIEYEHDYLRSVLDGVLPKIMPEQEKSEFLHCLLREILVVFVLQPILSLLSEPDFWNQQIDLFATIAIKEQKMVNRMREALDKPFSDYHYNPGKIHNIQPKMPSFDKYLVMIKECRNLLDAKRIHQSLLTELKRKQNLVLGKNDLDVVNGRRVVDMKKYINRVKIAVKKVEKKIVELGGTVLGDIGEELILDRPEDPLNSNLDIDYGDILNLLCEPALSYFREYLEKINEMDILQLYCAVQALNAQLTERSGKRMTSSFAILNMVDFEARKMVRNDVISIYSTYLIGNARASLINKKLDLIASDIQTLYSQIESTKIASEETISAALEYLKAVQMKARNYLQMFSLAFQNSDTFYRLLSDPETSKIPREFDKSVGYSSKSAESLRTRYSSLDKKYPGHERSVSESPALQTSTPISINKSSTQPEEQELFAQTPFVFAKPNAFSIKSSDPSTSLLMEDETLEAVQRVKIEIENILEDEPGYESPSPDMDDLEFMDEDHEDHGVVDISDGESEEFDESRKGNSKSQGNSSQSNSEISSPVDLLESFQAEINRIDASLAKIRQQKTLLQYMSIEENEDSGKASKERKLLRKMRFQFEQEEKMLENERRQIQWKRDGTLIIPGETKISIPTYELVEASHSFHKQAELLPSGKRRPFVIYFIEIHQPSSVRALSDISQSGWMMARRYSEFNALHRHLKEVYPEIMIKSKFNFPGKRFLTASRVKTALFPEEAGISFQSPKEQEFAEQRRRELECYLQALAGEPEIAKSWVFRQFLCEDKHYTFTLKGIRDFFPKKKALVGMFNTLSRRSKNDDRPSFEGADRPHDVFDQNSAQERLVVDNAASSSSDTLIHQERRLKEASKSTASLESLNLLDAGVFELPNKGAESISGLVLELFDLNEKTNWWRRQALTWVMQQFLGGTFERRISDMLSDYTNEESLSFYLTSLNDMLELWKRNPQPIVRSQTERAQSRLSVYKKLNLLIPDIAGSIVGKANAKRGSNRLFDLMQNKRLNQDLVYRTFDLLMKRIFPPVSANSEHRNSNNIR